jgi:hypothetical protein
MTKLINLAAAAAAAFALFATPALADDQKKEGDCENCAHHKAMAAKAGAPADAKPATADAACACKNGDANAKCKCEPGKCACVKAAAHGEKGHDCANCAHHGGEKAAPAKGETKT